MFYSLLLCLNLVPFLRYHHLFVKVTAYVTANALEKYFRLNAPLEVVAQAIVAISFIGLCMSVLGKW